MSNGSQASKSWVDIEIQRSLVQGAFSGIGISMAFSFVILMIVTRNLITSLTAIYCVTIIITSILTFMYWDGQQLGFDQSTGIVMLIGFAVDYVLHLSTDFMHSAQPTRSLKMQQAYREMGVSIFSGCITTFFCGFILLFAKFVIFQNYAFILTLTVTIAFLFSMGVFGAAMHAYGPEKGFCTIKCGENSDH